MNTTPESPASGDRVAADPENQFDHDAIVIGAGLAGLYMLHSLRSQGLDVQVIEAGAGVGGTWYWNRYPGARCDVESFDYSYSFSPELEQEWEWTERYPAQPEIERYINFVADRFDLRRDIMFDTRVTAAAYDENRNGWAVSLDSGARVHAKYLIAATGTLSTPLKPSFEGIDDFAGEWYQTQKWPHHDVSFEGKRVAVIGTGSSGVQSIPVIAQQAEHLTVFQRTPNFSVPAHNHPLDPEYAKSFKRGYRDYREQQRYSGFGYADNIAVNEQSAMDVSDQERRANLEDRWRKGGAPNFMTSFSDLMTNEESNEVVSEFVREKIRAIVDDPRRAELLTPKDHPIATKRLCVDSHYYETYNRDNVDLVNVREEPIVRVTRTGIETSEAGYEFDVIVFAVGYDALTGSLLAMDITGRDGVSLRSHWAEGPKTYLGLAVSGFPNFFTVTGPHSPAVLAVMIVAIEQHVEWIADCIDYAEKRHIASIEASADAEAEWVQHSLDIASGTLFDRADSYYVGSNVPGKPRVVALYLGGFGAYRQICDEIAAAGYKGFELSRAAERTS